MSKKPLTKPEAIGAYKKAIMGTTIYRHGSDCMQVTIFWFISCFTTFLHFEVVGSSDQTHFISFNSNNVFE